MQINEIKELAKLMNSEGLSEIELKIPGMEIKLKKSNSDTIEYNNGSSFNHKKEMDLNTKEKEIVVEEIFNAKEIKSPIVGTFYESASPTSSPYIKVGDVVKKGDILCIVEAMKMMNEIESEFDGKIAKILVNNESPVEFGQSLFVIEGV